MFKSRGSSSPKVLIALLVLPGLFFSIARLQAEIDRHRVVESTPESFLLYLPPGKLLRPLTLGYREFAADLLWMKAIYFFGEHFDIDQNYHGLYEMLDLVTTLDPSFEYPYHFGSIVLSLEANQVEQSKELLIKGMEHLPRVWQFPFYMGFNLYFFENNFSEAAGYIDRASRLSGSPGFLRELAARLYAKGGNPSFGLTLLRELYQNTKDEKMRARISKKMEAMVRDHTDVPDPN